MTDSVFGILFGVSPMLLIAVMFLWKRLHRNELQIEALRERNDRTEEALEAYLHPAMHTIDMLKHRVQNLELALAGHMEEPHMPLDPGEARRAAREARARQRAIEEDLGG